MEIQFCAYCGTKLDDGARFCKNCGEAVGNNVHEEPKLKYEESKPKQEQPSTGNPAEREIVYEGSIHKCPNCGEVLQSFVVNCPTCGYELRSIKTSSPVSELSKKIETATSIDEKIELITNFYVPNTREDIYDFFILAVSNLEDNAYDTDDAWQAKLEQTYHKARITFGNSPEFEYIEKLYNKTHSKVSKRWLSNFIRKNKIICISVLKIGMGLLFLTTGIVMLSNDNEAGVILTLLSFILMFPLLFTELTTQDEKREPRKKKNPFEEKSDVQFIGKDAEEFLHEYYEDVAEELRELGFKNIVIKAVKKGLLDTEGAVKGISIAGKTEFSEDEEFDVNSKVIIRYYSRKY